MRTADFDYEIPPQLVAQEPLADRTAARLLALDRRLGTWQHRHVRDLPGLLHPGDVLVFNESRVLPARLHGVKPTGGLVEVLLVRPAGGDQWWAMTRPGLRIGQRLRIGRPPAVSDDQVVDTEVVAIDDTGLRLLRFAVSGPALWDAIHRVGEVPLPPYIRVPLADPERYQTVYARTEGSVAAPTAGLHFTVDLLDQLDRRGVQLEFVMLHVGPGTFAPVKVDDPDDHVMHAEWYCVPDDVAERLNTARREGRRVIAVGTTVVRTIESSADESGEIVAGTGETCLFIRPGYRFRAIDGLLTNFHLPRSTLLMLVCAFAGRELTLAAYREAVAEGYRFFSFGDAMLIL